MNEDSELFIKMKTMNTEELEEYLHISTVSSRVCAALGIGAILLALIFTNALTVPIAAIVVYITSQIACGVDELSRHIKHLINR